MQPELLYIMSIPNC